MSNLLCLLVLQSLASVKPSTSRTSRIVTSVRHAGCSATTRRRHSARSMPSITRKERIAGHRARAHRAPLLGDEPGSPRDRNCTIRIASAQWTLGGDLGRWKRGRLGWAPISWNHVAATLLSYAGRHDPPRRSFTWRHNPGKVAERGVAGPRAAERQTAWGARVLLSFERGVTRNVGNTLGCQGPTVQVWWLNRGWGSTPSLLQPRLQNGANAVPNGHCDCM